MQAIQETPILTLSATSRHLDIPKGTLHAWLTDSRGPLVHRVEDQPHNWPTIPFVGVVEAHVLRMLRHDLGLSMPKVREAALAVRGEFDTPYALATKRVATDGAEIFIEYASGEIARARDGQRPFREVIDTHLRFIEWGEDGWPAAIRLQQYEDVAPVIIDPRFAWGQPVVEENRVPIAAITEMWRAGDTMELIADEFELTREQVEAICRAAA